MRREWALTKLTPFPLSEGQAVLAAEIEALSDEDAREIYAVLVSIVHQMARLDAGLSKPTAVDNKGICDVFERYIDSLVKSVMGDLDPTRARMGLCAPLAAD